MAAVTMRRWSSGFRKEENEAKSHITTLEFRRADFKQQRATRLKKGLKNLLYGKRLRVVSVQPGEKKAQGDLIYVYKYLM